MKDDEAKAFSKRKYEKVNEKLRRIGEKKRSMKVRRRNHFKSGGKKK